MGSASSKSKVSQQQRFLIGTLNKKSDLNQKFYELSYNCLRSKSLDDSIKESDQYRNNEVQKSERQGSHGDHSMEERLSFTETEDKRSSDDINNVICASVGALSGPELFLPILGSKKLMCTQTYVAWRSIMDLEKIKSLLIKKRTIYLVQVDDFPEFLLNFRVLFNSEELTISNLAQKFLEAFFTGMDVQWMESISIASKKWNITSRHHKKTKKFQYLVTDFFPLLQKVCPKDGYCIMGLIWTDLFPKEELNFVLGEAHNPFKSGMVSFGRFEPKSYNEETHQDVTAVTTDVLWKLLKCLSHELCHLFGMAHCDFFSCTMNGSGSVKEAMDQPLFLCPVCVRKLQHICKFDIVQRYERMEQFLVEMNRTFPSENWNNSLVWIQRCLRYLKTTVTHL
ncbi:archaemetzincin-2-like [Argopecten irradians]|uniref:archaemetzincin-2-like n=1 Tax=Argopecten irradians TaxID=31199 RepID=UPI003722CFF2